MPCLIVLLWLGVGVSGALALHTVSTGILSPWEKLFAKRHFAVTGTRQQYMWNRQTRLFMGKGDGKKKRPKKSHPDDPDPAVSPPLPEPSFSNIPRRVSTEINIPVKLQIQMAQVNKEFAKERESPGFRQKNVVRTKYRRTWEEEEIEQKKEERKKRGQDINWDVVLNQTSAAPLVIVDGYNIIYSWPRLKKHMLKGDLQRARELLIDDLENLRSLKGWRIEVVFDGTGKSNVGPLGQGYKSRVTAAERANNIDESKYGVRVVYTGRGIEADSYIQSRCVSAKQVTEGYITGSFIVATDDGMIRIAGQNAGALCMGAERFVDELKSMKKAMSYRVEAAIAKVNGQSIRPEQLHGTHVHNFGRRSVVIEDKRERQRERLEKKQKEAEEAAKYLQEIESKMDLDADYTQVPNRTRTFP